MGERVRKMQCGAFDPARAPVDGRVKGRRDAVGRPLAAARESEHDRCQSHGSAPFAIKIMEK